MEYRVAMPDALNSFPLQFDTFYEDVNYNALRRMKLITIGGTLEKYEPYDQLCMEIKMEIIKKIENSCLNETVRKANSYNIRCSWDANTFVQIYHSVCYNILSALDSTASTCSPSLLQKIVSNTINLDEVASLTPRELCPEKFVDIIQKIDRRINTEHNIKYTELYFCRKCKKNKTTAERVQNRSNDEGSSYYITCLFCHNKWFGG